MESVQQGPLCIQGSLALGGFGRSGMRKKQVSSIDTLHAVPVEDRARLADLL